MGKNYAVRSMLVLTFFLTVFILGDFSDMIDFDVQAAYRGRSETENIQESGITVVVDAGHGGNDPGKVGVHGELEKDINLSIAVKLKRNLEHQGIRVIMVRETDKGLYSEGSSNKKREDMNRRIEMINNAGAVLAVSIHQNSFEDSRYSGAQVFYYKTSEDGKTLAGLLQKSLIQNTDPDNTRVEKDNDSYYLLKHSKIPMAIIECGFLSNADEAYMLSDEAYQEKLAWAIHLGIMQYIHETA